MNIPLTNSCEPHDFSKYYNFEFRTYQSLCPKLACQTSSEQSGGSCGCQLNNEQEGGNGNEKQTGTPQPIESENFQCPHWELNTSLPVNGPAFNLSETIGNRPVVGKQSDKNPSGESELDKQFDCLQPKWCESCQ